MRIDLSASQIAKACLQGGAKLIQLRDKKSNRETLIQSAKKIQELKRDFNFTFIINDDPILAKEINADGVHVGQADMSVHEARKVLGPDKIIGLSSHSLEEAVQGTKQPIDYLAVGAIFPTKTKPADHPVVGLELLRQVRDLTDKPLVAIGGITLENDWTAQ